jgi:hypothetical protein
MLVYCSGFVDIKQKKGEAMPGRGWAGLCRELLRALIVQFREY